MCNKWSLLCVVLIRSLVRLQAQKLLVSALISPPNTNKAGLTKSFDLFPGTQVGFTVFNFVNTAS